MVPRMPMLVCFRYLLLLGCLVIVFDCLCVCLYVGWLSLRVVGAALLFGLVD